RLCYSTSRYVTTAQRHAVMRRERFNLQPHLVGELLELRPLSADDWEGLFAAAADPMIWELHPAHDRYKGRSVQRIFSRGVGIGRSSCCFGPKDSENYRLVTVLLVRT